MKIKKILLNFLLVICFRFSVLTMVSCELDDFFNDSNSESVEPHESIPIILGYNSSVSTNEEVLTDKTKDFIDFKKETLEKNR